MVTRSSTVIPATRGSAPGGIRSGISLAERRVDAAQLAAVDRRAGQRRDDGLRHRLDVHRPLHRRGRGRPRRRRSRHGGRSSPHGAGRGRPPGRGVRRQPPAAAAARAAPSAAIDASSIRRLRHAVLCIRRLSHGRRLAADQKAVCPRPLLRAGKFVSEPLECPPNDPSGTYRAGARQSDGEGQFRVTEMVYGAAPAKPGEPILPAMVAHRRPLVAGGARRAVPDRHAARPRRLAAARGQERARPLPLRLAAGGVRRLRARC